MLYIICLRRCGYTIIIRQPARRPWFGAPNATESADGVGGPSRMQILLFIFMFYIFSVLLDFFCHFLLILIPKSPEQQNMTCRAALGFGGPRIRDPL